MKFWLIFALVFNLLAAVFNIALFAAGATTAIIWVPLNLLMAGWMGYLLYDYSNY